MSSLGDIVQTFYVLDYLRSRFPEAAIDWVTEEAFVSLGCSPSFRTQCIFHESQRAQKGMVALCSLEKTISVHGQAACELL